MKTSLTKFSFILLITSISTLSYARGGGGGGLGGDSIAFGVGMATPTQTDLDGYADAVNALGGGRSASKMSTGTEFSFQYQSRFSSSMYSLVFRPSYFTQAGKGGTDSVTLTGYSFFPMLRLYPLENNFIHFFMQAGIGYAKLSGKIDQPSGSLEFSGSAFGAVAGLGADFCFTPSQCMYLEGNFRYLPVQRSIVSSNTGASSGLSQSGAGQELEINQNDLQTTMSGIIGSIGYQFIF